MSGKWHTSLGWQFSSGAERVLGAALLGTVLFGVAACSQPSGGDEAAEDSGAATSRTSAELSEVEEYDVAAEHVTTAVDYGQTPPVGGPHNPLWLNCGFYDDVVPSENAVHSMEHGAVWITYDPTLTDDEVGLLRAQMPPTYVVLSPYDGLPAPVVASAWGRQLALEGPEDPRLEAFVREYRQGGIAPEIGASCSGASDGTLPLDAVEKMG